MAEIKEQTADALIECLNDCSAPGDVGLIITDNKGNEFRVKGVWVTQFGQFHPHIVLEQVEDMSERWIQPYWYQVKAEESKLEIMLSQEYKDNILKYKHATHGSEQFVENMKFYDEIIEDQRRYVNTLKKLAGKEQ